MSDRDIESWKSSMRILLRHHLWKAMTEIVKESSVLENELLTFMQDEDEIVRQNVINIISYLEPRKKYFSHIKEALNDSSPKVRAAAARYIIHFDKNQSRLLILNLLSKEQEDDVIQAILESLKEIGELGDIEIIAPFIEAKSTNVANEARTAITHICGRQIQPTIIEKLQRFWRTSDKLTIVELPIFLCVLAVGFYLWNLNLQQAAFMALLFTYSFGRLRTLKPYLTVR